MKVLLLALVVILAACTTSKTTTRPTAEPVQYDVDFSGMVQTYAIPVPDTVDVSHSSPPEGAIHINQGDPRFTLPQLPKGKLHQASRAAMQGFTCPVRGVVYVSAIIGREGTALAPQVRLGIHESCDKRALAVLANAQFVPAEFDGEAMPVLLTLPVRFN